MVSDLFALNTLAERTHEYVEKCFEDADISVGLTRDRQTAVIMGRRATYTVNALGYSDYGSGGSPLWLAITKLTSLRSVENGYSYNRLDPADLSQKSTAHSVFSSALKPVHVQRLLEVISRHSQPYRSLL